MSGITRQVTMAATSKVMRLWQIWRVGALPLTVGDVGRVGWDIEAVKTLENWAERLKDDRLAVESFAKSGGWSEDEKNAIRVLWRSRIILMEACKERIAMIARYQQEARNLESRVAAYLAMRDGDKPLASEIDLPF
jgi:hypothetical protein